MPCRAPAIFPLLVAACLCPGRSLAQDNRLLAKLPGPSGTAAEFSRDGKLILTAGRDEARVWDAQTFKPVTRPLRYGREFAPLPLTASFSPDGTKVLTAGHTDGDACVWDAATGKRLLVIRHPAPGKDLRRSGARFSPDGRRIVTFHSPDVSARVWDAATGESVAVLEHHRRVVFATFSADGGRMLTATLDEPLEFLNGDGSIHLWDVDRQREVRRSNRHYVAPLRPAAFSPDGRRTAVPSEDGVAIWDSESGKDARAIAGDEEMALAISAVAFSPDGRLLATAGLTAQVWDTSTGRRASPDLPPSYPMSKDVVFSHDGRTLLTGGCAYADGSAVWDVATGKILLAIRPHARPKEDWLAPYPAVAFSHDGRRVAAGFPSDGFTGVWAVDPPEREKPRK